MLLKPKGMNKYLEMKKPVIRVVGNLSIAPVGNLSTGSSSHFSAVRKIEPGPKPVNF